MEECITLFHRRIKVVRGRPRMTWVGLIKEGYVHKRFNEYSPTLKNNVSLIV